VPERLATLLDGLVPAAAVAEVLIRGHASELGRRIEAARQALGSLAERALHGGGRHVGMSVGGPAHRAVDQPVPAARTHVDRLLKSDRKRNVDGVQGSHDSERASESKCAKGNVFKRKRP